VYSGATGYQAPPSNLANLGSFMPMSLAAANGQIYTAGTIILPCTGRLKNYSNVDWSVRKGLWSGSAWTWTEQDHYTLVPCSAANPYDMLVASDGSVSVVGMAYDSPSQVIRHWIVRACAP
jgi:hypothetical protein